MYSDNFGTFLGTFGTIYYYEIVIPCNLNDTLEGLNDSFS